MRAGIHTVVPSPARAMRRRVEMAFTGLVGGAKIGVFRALSKCRIITVITHLEKTVHDAPDPRRR